VDQHAAYADRFGRLHDAQCAVAKQRAPDALPMKGAVDGEPSENGDRIGSNTTASETAQCRYLCPRPLAGEGSSDSRQ